MSSHYGLSGIRWNVKELAQILRERQLNKFDVNVLVSGKRGDGKSTLIHKIMLRFKKDGFRHRKHQVYDREDVMNLLAEQTFGFVWDDEAVNSGYKRDFQNQGQKELIKLITNFRDNYNLYFSAIPSFYSLDKDLRDLTFMHIHIIERGLAVILIALESSIHTADIWDTKNNMAIEQKENERVAKDPTKKFRYHLFSTFAGYLYFGDVTEKQREIYKKVKDEKRSKRFSTVFQAVQKLPQDKLNEFYKDIINEKLSRTRLHQLCLEQDLDFKKVCYHLNKRLKDDGYAETLLQKLSQIDKAQKSSDPSNNKQIAPSVKNLVPDIQA